MEDLKESDEQTLNTDHKKRNKKHFENKQQCDGKLVNKAMESDFQKLFSDKNVKNHETNANFFSIKIHLDGISLTLFLMGLISRLYKLHEPNYVVFDELHYGKYVSMYIQNTFYFASNPPFGIQLISLISYLCGYDGKFKFDAIGRAYSPEVPLYALRIVPAFFGSLLVPLTYHILLELNLSPWTALLGALLILFDNAFLTQSRFILMETIFICFAAFGLFCVLRFCKYKYSPYSFNWWLLMFTSWTFLTLAVCVKYVAFYTYFLGIVLILHNFWNILPFKNISDKSLFIQFCTEILFAVIVPSAIYLGVFYVHLNVLYKAGPHDNVLTSAFQASLEGGLASITKGQPLIVAHGSQITLRHSHGRTCWLHSHQHVYPVRYSDKRGSSHQQQVTCYSFKDVNNWWIVKRPEKNELVVENPIDSIKHGDVIQLVHGLTSRALNSHDVAAPMSPQCQEVSCYIDYNISMPAQNLWKVDIINREQVGNVWRAIQSQVRLIHLNSNQALKYSGKQLPDWGFHQHEVVTDRIIYQDDTIWNVEEHVYTKSEDQKDRERDIIASEMIPTSAPQLSFWNKFFELQYKMLFQGTESVQNHMFSSEPFEWPLMVRGIAYWVSNHDNAQIHLIGNIIIWYTATFSVVAYCLLFIYYLLRRQRLCFDLENTDWETFKRIGLVFLQGYFFNYLPYFFVERTLFLHNYLLAYYFKILLIAGLFEHIYILLKTTVQNKIATKLFVVFILMWLIYVIYIFKKFTLLNYGVTNLTLNDIRNLRWRNSWDFIYHRN